MIAPSSGDLHDMVDLQDGLPAVGYIGWLASAGGIFAPSLAPKKDSLSGICQPDRPVAGLFRAASLRCFFLLLD
ncbi:hypothetical protein OG613_44850 (plasmid) [Streptomyces sp. NBC_00015]|uniref:hypothetical protein n=1 Tax=Streptomyces sp. NBC_00015 TaxID=2903611 RepID=UPI002F90E657